MNDHDDFRDRLLAAQQLTPEYREKYERSLESMFTRQLTPGQRAVRILCVMSGLVFVVGVILGFTTQRIQIASHEMSSQSAITVILLALGSLAITLLSIGSVITGTVNLRWQPRVIAYAAFFGVLLASSAPVIIGFAYGVSMSVVYLLLVLLMFMMPVTAKLILVHIEQSELAIREKLLEIELRLAEMSEQMARKQP